MASQTTTRMVRLLRQLPSTGRVTLRSLPEELASCTSTLSFEKKVDIKSLSQVSVITLDRPMQRNALSAGMLADLSEAVSHLEGNPGRAVFLRGAGANFCAGADLQLLSAFASEDGKRELSASQLCGFMQDVTRRFRALPCVSIALLEGVAIGGGAELITAAADLRLARIDACIQWRQVSMGLTPGFGGLLPLLRLVGERRALKILLDGELIEAPQAADWGLVDTLFPIWSPCENESPQVDKSGISQVTASNDMLYGAALWFQNQLLPQADDCKTELLHAVKHLVHSVANGSHSEESLLALERNTFERFFDSVESRTKIHSALAKLKSKNNKS